MKTLSEEISEVMKSTTAKAQKRIYLKNLGLTDHDIYALFSIEAGKLGETTPAYRRPRTISNVPTLASIVRKMTFGVEIECYKVMSRTGLCETARRHGLKMQFEGYNHTDHAREFKLVTDASLEGDGNIECVSPVLSGAQSGFKKLHACCDSLAEVGADVNKSTGLHIHVGDKTMTETQYVNTFKNYQKLEGLIDSFMSPSRRGAVCRWAKTLVGINFASATTIEGVRNAMHRDRYYKVNAEAYSRHRTIEFRQHQGSIDYTKISMWASFCLKLVAWSKDNVLTNVVTDIKDVPFLTAREKAFFKSRIEGFRSGVALAA